MVGPWEKYAAPEAAPATAGPWQRYRPVAGSSTRASEAPDGVMRLEMAHDDAPNTAERIGRTIMDAGRQVGLTARYGLEGIGQAAQLFTEPLRTGVVNPVARAVGLPEAAPTGQAMSSLADLVGLPAPRDGQERVVGDVARLMAGGGGLAGGAGALARGATGVTQAVLQGLAANPGQQVASAAGAGAAGGAVREAGGGELAQAGAALAGGVGGALLSQALVSIGQKSARTADAVMRSLSPARAQQIEQRIEVTLRQAGVDWSDVPERIRNSMREQVEKALRTGDDLDPAALRRLLDFQRVPGAIPTRGMLTLDPVQVTRERNLAKTGANATDSGLQGLARVENRNNQALIDALNRAGADTTDDAYAAGNRLVGALQRGLDDEQAGVNRLYQAARDNQGRSFPLDGASFTQRAGQALDDALLSGALPPDVRNHLNRIARGEVPFTVDYAEQLKTAMGKLQRATNDGQARMALSIVRRALDDTPVLGLGEQTAAAGARAVNPGNLPAVPGAPQLGEDAVAAFNQARAANRAMMQRIEASPALQAIYEGNVTPEKFVQQFIVGQGRGASVDDVRGLAREIMSVDPRGMDVARGQIARWLKDAAIGRGTADEVGVFSASGFRRAMDALGDQKLRAFFSPEEVSQLRAVANVANYMKTQPAGSAVNNSNSGALVIGRGLDWLDRIAGRVPLLGIGPTVTGAVRSVQQGQAQRVAPALVTPAARAARGSVARPALTFGSLFATPAVDSRQDD